MPKLIVKHRVEDYESWKTVFDSARQIRKVFGEKDCVIFRDTEDPNELILLMEWDNVEKAVKYSQSEELRMAMRQSGVLEEPKIYLEDKNYL